jgi:hypothetical protein
MQIFWEEDAEADLDRIFDTFQLPFPENVPMETK